MDESKEVAALLREYKMRADKKTRLLMKAAVLRGYKRGIEWGKRTSDRIFKQAEKKSNAKNKRRRSKK